MGGNESPRRKPTGTREEHANSTPGWESNTEPLTTAPPSLPEDQFHLIFTCANYSITCNVTGFIFISRLRKLTFFKSSLKGININVLYSCINAAVHGGIDAGVADLFPLSIAIYLSHTLPKMVPFTNPNGQIYMAYFSN